jgi:hypothetical protein
MGTEIMEGRKMLIEPEMQCWKSPEINEITNAIIRAQLALKPVEKKAVNPFFHSKYADLPDCWEAVRCFLEEGIAIVQLPMPSLSGSITLDTMLAHGASGQWLKSRLTMPLVKLDPQGTGSAITYARRYAIGCMTGLVTDEDDDGNDSSKPSRPAYKPVPKPAVAPAQSPVGGASEAAPPVALDAPIIWNAGKPPHRGQDIRKVDVDYLRWYEVNGPQDEYRIKASQELDRRDLEQDANRELPA